MAHPTGPGPSLNEVRLQGRITTAPQRRLLPSGDEIVTLRLSVVREGSPLSRGSRQTADWLDCSAWGAKVRRTVSGWRAGDLVAIEGALRRRFYRSDAGTATRVEIEVMSGRLLRRADRTGPRERGTQG